MSDLYQIKILSRKDIIIPSYEIYELNTVDHMKNMKPQLEQLKIDVSHEDKIVSFKRFAEILKEKNIKETRLFYSYRNSPYYCKDIIMDIRNNYSKENIGKIFSCMSFAWYQMFSELFPEEYSPFYTTELIAEVVSIHPDAAFPKKKARGSLIDDNKLFALRLLVDAHERTDINKIKEYYNLNGGINKNRVSDSDIIWGYQEIDKLVIKPKDKDFWKEHEGAWWADNFRDTVTNKYYECRKVRLILPIGWYPEISGESRAYDSTAFW